jgi:hypothetical protein
MAKKIIYFAIILNFLMLNDANSMFSGNMINENNSVIKNEISASAETGGNKTDNGKIMTGQPSLKIKINTQINGETAADIDINEKTEEKIEIKVDNEIKADSRSAEIKTNINKNGEVESSKKIIEFNAENNSESPVAIENHFPENEAFKFQEDPYDANDVSVAKVENEQEMKNGLLYSIIDFFSDIKNKIINIFS